MSRPDNRRLVTVMIILGLLSPILCLGQPCSSSSQPRIIEQPQDTLAMIGDSVTLSSSALAGPMGPQPPEGCMPQIHHVYYQWTHDGSAIPGANEAIFTLPAVSVEDAGVYRCFVAHYPYPGGTHLPPPVWSDPAVLTVNEFMLAVPGGCRAQGLSPLTLSTAFDDVVGVPDIVWEDLVNGDTYVGQTITFPMFADTREFEVVAVDDSDRSATAWVRILVATAGNVDLNGDGWNDIWDVFHLAEGWGGVQLDPDDDLDGDGALTIFDFLYVNTDDSL